MLRPSVSGGLRKWQNFAYNSSNRLRELRTRVKIPENFAYVLNPNEFCGRSRADIYQDLHLIQTSFSDIKFQSTAENFTRNYLSERMRVEEWVNRSIQNTLAKWFIRQVELIEITGKMLHGKI